MGGISYAGPSALEVVPLLWAYAAWIAFTVAFFAVGMATCAANAGPLAPDPNADVRFKSEREGEAKFRATYKARFGSQELAYVALINGAAGVLLWFAAEGRLWAAGILAVFSLWLIYSHATTPFTLRQMNPRLIGPLDWSYYLAGALFWLYVAACIALRLNVKL
jgi:hypothetical protein